MNYSIAKTLICMLMASNCVMGNPYQPVSTDSSGIAWYAITQDMIEGQGWKDVENTYDRLPAKAYSMVRPEVWNLSRHTAGISIRFNTDSPLIKIKWKLLHKSLDMPHMPATGVSGIDLYALTKSGNWIFMGNGRARKFPENSAEFKNSIMEPVAEFRLYLPLYNGVTSISIGIPYDFEMCKLDPHAIKPIVFYGTSITQGGCASRPGLASTTITGRYLNTPVINLGFSGNGRMDMELATLIGELNPQLIVFDCMHNMTTEQVKERVIPFTRIVRDRHPDTPILLVEGTSYRNITPTSDGKILRKHHQQMIEEGDNHLYFLSNKDMLGNDTEGTVDKVHPNDIGMMRQARVFSETISTLLEKY